MKRIFIYSSILLVLINFKTQGQTIIDVAKASIDNPIGKKVGHYYDASRELTLNAVSKKSFSIPKKLVPNFGYNTGADWLKIILLNSSDKSKQKILRINKPLIDSIQLFYIHDHKLKTDISGILVTKKKKFKHSKSNYFPIEIPANDTITYYLRIVSMHSKQLSIHLDDDYEYVYYEQGVTIMIGFYLGALLIITLYNLFLGISIKDPVYLLYAFSNLGALLGTLTLKGFFTGYIFPNNPAVSLLLIPVFIISFSIFSSFFCIKLVDIKKYNKVAYYLFIAVVLFGVCAMVVPYTLTQLGHTTTYRHLASGTLLFTIIAWASGVIAIRNGNRNAKYYLIGWTVGLVGAFLYVFLLFGYLPLNFLTDNLYMIGSVIEVLALSFALADRYNRVQLERNEFEKNLQFREGDLAMVISDNKMRHQFRQQLLQEVEEVNKVDNDALRGKLNHLIADLRVQLDTEGKLNYFQDNIESINAEFESRLKTLNPELTQSEVELCYLIKLKLSNKEMANFRKTSEGAIKVARHRIRKKLGQNFESIVNGL